jgi:hypothetical protein
MAMSALTVKQWHREAAVAIQSAKATHSDASRQAETSSKARGDVVAENLNQYTELHKLLDQKVKCSHKLVEKLRLRAESLENSIGLTRQTLQQLEAALRAKEMPLRLCMLREEQREKRPARERVRDAVAPMLEAEKSNLLGSQKQLKAAVAEAKSALQGLEGRLREVRSNQEQKAQALSLDEACYESTCKSWRKAAGSTPEEHRTATRRLPAAAVGNTPSKSDELSTTYKNEVNRQRETERLDRTSAGQEQAAKALREQSAKLVLNTATSAQDHRAKVDQALQEGARQNQQVRKRLEFEIKETQAKIQRTKATIAQTKERLESLREPMNNTSSCVDWRSKRAQTEHIQDPVSTKLAEHQSTLQRNHESLSRNAAEEQRVLKELQQHEAQLSEDLRDKTAAFQIAMACLAAPMKPGGKAVPSTVASSRSARRSLGAMSVDQGPLGSAGGVTIMSARF